MFTQSPGRSRSLSARFLRQALAGAVLAGLSTLAVAQSGARGPEEHAAVPPDAVAGVPREYAEQVLAHTIPVIATRIPTAEIIATWAGVDATGRPPD